MKIVQSRMTLIGNINNPDTLLKGEPSDVERDVRQAIDAGVQIIAPECAIPLVTPNCNLKAIVATAKEYGKKNGGQK
jgi:[methyl-Co(III) methanol-specific corrinoid protein]:coenzyme M methyltransferase